LGNIPSDDAAISSAINATSSPKAADTSANNAENNQPSQTQQSILPAASGAPIKNAPSNNALELTPH
jgi:hypothetical protein